MLPLPSESEGRAGSICVWFTILVSILAGGAFLVLYITLPTSDYNSWFPIAGMALIGIPWAFWIFTCIYSSVGKTLSNVPTGRAHSGWAHFRISSVAPSNSTRSGFESSLTSPGRARKVRFAEATVLESHKEEEGGKIGGEKEGEGNLQVGCMGGSSGGLPESKKPLALSMVS